jgi:Ca2+-binding RTX toxin-like protein
MVRHFLKDDDITAAEQAGISRLYGGIHMMDGNWLGQIAGAQVGNQVTAKALSLFSGEQTAGQAALQTFGSMAADILTGDSSQEGERVQEIYGFGGDDILITGGRDVCSLFGGDGVDTFTLGSLKAAYIRDLQEGESILLKSEIFGAAQDLGDLQLATSSLGDYFTDLLFQGNVLAHIDGNFIDSNKINLGFIA